VTDGLAIVGDVTLALLSAGAPLLAMIAALVLSCAVRGLLTWVAWTLLVAPAFPEWPSPGMGFHWGIHILLDLFGRSFFPMATIASFRPATEDEAPRRRPAARGEWN
jgi:hypothetical protein